jgi:hypothetical protein
MLEYISYVTKLKGNRSAVRTVSKNASQKRKFPEEQGRSKMVNTKKLRFGKITQKTIAPNSRKRLEGAQKLYEVRRTDYTYKKKMFLLKRQPREIYRNRIQAAEMKYFKNS